MKTARRILLLLLVIGLPVGWDLHVNGFAPGNGCDPGFGKRLHAQREAEIRRAFLEPLPPSIEVESVTCSGFTDSTWVATFHVTTPEARQLVTDLEATFQARQNRPIGSDAQKRRRMIGRPSVTTHVYELPGLPLFDTRTVSVSIPADAGVATVVFEGGNF